MTALERLFATAPLIEREEVLPRMRRLLEALGSPDAGLRIVHVAGTNAKGTTCALCNALLMQTGRGAGLFTSPYLQHFTERILINGKPLSEDAWEGLARRVLDAADGIGPLPQFGLYCAMALLAFAEADVEFVVWETGLGGLYDPTSAVMPAVCAITPIALDHQAQLGDNVALIAQQKAGILKPGVPCCFAPQSPEVQTALEDAARTIAAPILATCAHNLPCHLQGPGVADSVAVALACVQHLIDLSPAQVANALTRVRWPGRLEWVGDDLLLDGAHNPAAAEMLACYLQSQNLPPVTLLLGALDHDAEGVARALIPTCAGIITTTPPSPRALPAADYAARIRGLTDLPVESVSDPAAALLRARALGRPIVATGSLFLVGALRNALELPFEVYHFDD